MRSITSIELQYAHRLYGLKGEAQYLHGHTGVLTIEVEYGVNTVNQGNEIKRIIMDVLKDFDHALVLRYDDPLLPAVLNVYEKQGIYNGHSQIHMNNGEALHGGLATAYPECHIVVTKESMTIEGMINIVYETLKNKLNVAKLTFTSDGSTASAEYDIQDKSECCSICGVELKELGVCPKCGYTQRY